jgi:colicin import membrane protein
MDNLFNETPVKTEALVKIKASDYGLEESKAKEIEALFLPMLAKMSELENEYNDILKEEINPETCQRAKDLRSCYVKTRTGTAEIHKKAKEFYLNGGRFVDGWKNAQLFASGEKEKTLKAIEDHFENLEWERVKKLREERVELLKPYTDIEPLALGNMEQSVFDNYLTGVKLAHEQKIAAEKKAEEDRIAKEKADADARETQRLENIRLKAEVEEKERLAEIERKKNEKIIAAQKAKADTERKERERLEAEIEARKQADEKAKKEELARIESEKRARLAEEKKAKLAPDKDKLLAFVQTINDLPRPEVKSIRLPT